MVVGNATDVAGGGDEEKKLGIGLQYFESGKRGDRILCSSLLLLLLLLACLLGVVVVVVHPRKLTFLGDLLQQIEQKLNCNLNKYFEPDYVFIFSSICSDYGPRATLLLFSL
jgi:hypothetical protein